MIFGKCPKTWDSSAALNFAAQPAQLESCVSLISIVHPLLAVISVMFVNDLDILYDRGGESVNEEMTDGIYA